MDRAKYGLFRSSDTTAVIELLASALSAADPPAVAMGLTQSEMERFVGLLCPRAAADGLTVVARALDTNQIVGALLTDDFGAQLELDLTEVSDKFLPILTMLDGLDGQYRQGRSIAAGQYLHLFNAGRR